MSFEYGPADPNYDGPKPNIVIHPDDYPRYVNSATIYSRVIEKTKHVLYKNKYLAHRDKEQYPDHVTLWTKQRPIQRPWYHVHQCLDEKCPVHPGDVKLHKVMEANVDHELKAEPNFLCSYLKDKVDIDQFPYYKESIKTFYSSKSKANTKACGDITMVQNRRSLLALWHDPYCDGCERKDLHVGPVVEDKPQCKDELVIEDKPQCEDVLVAEDESRCADVLVAEDESRCEDEVIQRDVFEIKDDISDILFKYRFLFSTEYLYGSSAKINLIKTNQEVNNVEKKESESSTVHTTNANIPTKCEAHAEASVDQGPSVISTCVGQVPRTPARHYNNKRQFTPKYQTPYGSPFIKSNHGSYYTNTPSPYYTPSQSTLHLSPYNSRSPYIHHTSRTTSPYSPTGIPYTSPYSAMSGLIYSPTAHQANRYLHGYPISNQFDYPVYASQTSLQQYQSLSYRTYPYAPSPGLSTDYQSRFRQLYMMYNEHWNNTQDEYNRDHHQYEHDTNTDDYPDYESEDPLRTHESRHDDDRADEPRYSYDTEYRRPRSKERNYDRYNDRRYRTDTRRSRSPSRRERSPIDRHRHKRDRSPSGSSRKRHRTTHSCDTERPSARHSKSNHSMSSERSRHSRDSRSSSLKSVGKRKTSHENPKSKNSTHKKSSKRREGRKHATERPKTGDCKKKSSEKQKSTDERSKSTDRSKSRTDREKSSDRLKSKTNRSKSSDRSKSKTNSEKSSKKDRKLSSDKQESKRR